MRLLNFLTSILGIAAFQNGVDTCVNTPNHGSWATGCSPTSCGTSPFSIQIRDMLGNNVNSFLPSTRYSVLLRGPAGSVGCSNTTCFRGFVLNVGNATGTFSTVSANPTGVLSSIDPNVRAMTNCANGLTHQSNNYKNTINATWMSPAMSSSVVFKAVIVTTSTTSNYVTSRTLPMASLTSTSIPTFTPSMTYTSSSTSSSSSSARSTPTSSSSITSSSSSSITSSSSSSAISTSTSSTSNTPSITASSSSSAGSSSSSSTSNTPSYSTSITSSSSTSITPSYSNSATSSSSNTATPPPSYSSTGSITTTPSTSITPSYSNSVTSTSSFSVTPSSTVYNSRNSTEVVVYVPVPSSNQNQSNYVIIGVFAVTILVLGTAIVVVVSKRKKITKKPQQMRGVIVIGDYNEYVTNDNPLVRRPSGILSSTSRAEFEPVRPRYSV